jgi:hypothetical protein
VYPACTSLGRIRCFCRFSRLMKSITYVFSIYLKGSTPTQRDPQAVAVLSQMVATTGWAIAMMPRDVMANGSVTVETGSNSESKSIIIKGRAGHQLRIEFPGTGTVIVVNGERGQKKTADGAQRIQRHATLSMEPLPFLFLTPLVDLGAQNLAMHYVSVYRPGCRRGARPQPDRGAGAGRVAECPCKGQRLGRPRVVVDTRRIAALRSQRRSWRAVANELGVSRNGRFADAANTPLRRTP